MRTEWEEKDDLVQRVIQFVRLYENVISEQRDQIEQERDHLLPETEVMMWMVIAVVIHDVLEEISERTDFSYEELASEVPDKYIHSDVRSV